MCQIIWINIISFWILCIKNDTFLRNKSDSVIQFMEIHRLLKYTDCEQKTVSDVPWSWQIFTCSCDACLSIGETQGSEKWWKEISN